MAHGRFTTAKKGRNPNCNDSIPKPPLVITCSKSSRESLRELVPRTFGLEHHLKPTLLWLGISIFIPPIWVAVLGVFDSNSHGWSEFYAMFFLVPIGTLSGGAAVADYPGLRGGFKVVGFFVSVPILFFMIFLLCGFAASVTGHGYLP